VAAEVAARLGVDRLDTGAMYRAVTLLVLNSGSQPSDEKVASELAVSMELEVGERVRVNGLDVTSEIRAQEVDRAVSIVAAHSGVRRELVRRQREWAHAREGGVVEGRDIGSVVFPDAKVKIYLTADPTERARRREVARPELERRDGIDSTREMSPLAVAKGAIVVDSTGMSVDEVVEEVLSYL
jgi:cytidylate kinase